MVAPFLKELRKWISTSGKKWLEQKQTPSSAALIGDETEIEEEISPPQAMAIDSSAELRNLLGIPPNGAAKPNGNYNTTGTDEATARLKNFLNLPGPITEPADASSKLKSLLNVGGGRNNAQIAEQSLKPNPQTLLAILQNRGGSPNSQRTATPSGLPPPTGQHPSPAPILVHHSPTSPPNNTMENFHSQIRPTHPPSPPPTSSFAGPHQMYDQPHNQPHPPSHLFTHRRFNQPMPPSHHHDEPPTFLNRPPGRWPPPTSLDALMPPPAPSNPPDPGQAVKLLSILKSAAPGPPITPHTPPPALAANPSPTPFQPYFQQEQQTKQTALQAPPALTTSRSQHENNLLDTLRASATVTTRPASATPLAQYDSPPRHMTSLASGNPNASAMPVYSAIAAPQTNRFPSKAPYTSRTPVPASTTPQPTSFDRRQSVSSEQQRALLAIFTNGTPTPHEDSAVISSPEEVKPATPLRSRTTSFARRVIPISPLSREKDGLLAYLETVAKEGGQ